MTYSGRASGNNFAWLGEQLTELLRLSTQVCHVHDITARDKYFIPLLDVFACRQPASKALR